MQTDVHSYDGILPPMFFGNISREDKLIAFERFPNNIIVNDFKTNPVLNYDPTNNLHADDLLYVCCLLLDKVPDKDFFLFIFNEQMNDILGGQCASGRTHRLYQIIVAFEDYL